MFRHCITKFSNYHFVSCKKYFNRVIQLGEKKKNISNVGSLGVEAFSKSKTISRSDLEKNLKINFSKKKLSDLYKFDNLWRREYQSFIKKSIFCT